MIKFHIFDNFPEQAAEYIANVLNKEEGGVFSLSGGLTPKVVYQVLKCKSLMLDKYLVVLGDERLVAEGDPRSNAVMIKEACPKFNLVAPNLQADDVVGDYNSRLHFDQVSVMLMGLGEDFHTCSLFPDNNLSLDVNAPYIQTFNSLDQTDRLSLSPRYVAEAKNKILLVTGSKKGEVLRNLYVNELQQFSYEDFEKVMFVDEARIRSEFKRYPSLLAAAGSGCDILLDRDCSKSLFGI